MKPTLILSLVLTLTSLPALANESDPLIYSAADGSQNGHTKVRFNADKSIALFLNNGIAADARPAKYETRDCTEVLSPKMFFCPPTIGAPALVVDFYTYDGQPSERETTITTILASTPFEAYTDTTDLQKIGGNYSTLDSTPGAELVIDVVANTVSLKNDSDETYIVPLKIEEQCLVIPGFSEMIGGYFSAGPKKLCFSAIAGILNVFGQQPSGEWVRVGHTGEIASAEEDGFLFKPEHKFETGGYGG